MKRLLFLTVLFLYQGITAQTKDSLRLDFKEYMAIVKKYHPLVRQSGLVVEEADFKLMKARGAFDPKLQADFSEKEYKSTEYYNLFNAAFKIPTYYGIELKAQYESNEGEYLNPQNKLPDNRLYAAGISLDLTNGLFMSERMSALKQAKIYRQQSRVKKDLLVADILYEASLAYFEWYASYQRKILHQNFIANSEFRLASVKKEFRAGDKPAVDTLEANIAFDNRLVQWEQARLDYLKASLELSNFLWTENNIPVEITLDVIPQEKVLEQIDELWQKNEMLALENMDGNPNIQYLQNELDILEVEKKLKANKLLPDISLHYNFLTEEPEEWPSLNTENYKFGIKFSLPVFMRKERGELELAKLQVENSKYELVNAGQEISNKLKAIESEIISYRDQKERVGKLAGDYEKLVYAEQRKFELGDSSLFLVNSRENSLLLARMKEIDVILKFLKSKAALRKLRASF